MLTKPPPSRSETASQGDEARKRLLADRLARIRARAEPDAQPADRPRVRRDPAGLFEPFSLNDMQQAYWLGRDRYFDAGNVPMHYYVELEGRRVRVERLEEAWNRLIERHPMLRALVLTDGRQQIQRSTPRQEIAVHDLRQLDTAKREASLAATRDRLAHFNADLTSWPHHVIECSRLAETTRVHISIDLWCVDGRSLQILFEELGKLYAAPDEALPDIGLTFRDCALFQGEHEKSPAWRKSFAYWQDRVRSLPPPPELPYARKASEVAAPRFERHSGILEPERKVALETRARALGSSLAAVMATAYAETLALFAKTPHFTLNVPHFNRPDVHPDINQVIGEFSSFTLLEVDFRQPADFTSRLRAVQNQLWRDIEHAAVPGVRVLRELGRHSPSLAGSAMPIVFTTAPERVIDGKRSEIEEILETLGRVVFSLSQTPQVWLDCQYFELAGQLHYNFDAIADLFPEGVLESMFGVFERVLLRLTDEPDAWTRTDLATLPDAQRRRREAINDTGRDWPFIDPWQALETIARSHPDRLAVVAADSRLTYGELHRRAKALAGRLAELGAGPGSRIALCLPKGMDQPVAVMASCLLSAAYVPIDATWPDRRIAAVLANAEPAAVIVADGAPAPTCSAEIVRASEGGTHPVEHRAVGPDAPAYVIYTSGSTGMPKGVVVTHGNLSNLLNFSNRHFELSGSDVVFAVTGLHHDLSVYDLFGAFSVGACLAMPAAEAGKDPFHWLDCVRRHGVTFWNSVPLSMEMLVTAAEGDGQGLPSTLRNVVLGGDWVPTTLPGRLRRLCPDVRITTIGGPTETTVWNIFNDATDFAADLPSIPYGKPIANSGYRILDEQLRDRPDWVAGQMYCTGAPLADGYWNAPEETAERFIADPESGGRMYATGDLGRYLPDGNIEFLGRIDFQINVNGYRAEPAEIEQDLMGFPGLRHLVVQARAEPEPHIAAFLCPRPGVEIDIAAFRAFAEQRLAEQIRPKAVAVIEELPLNDNGKADRKALQAIEVPFLATRHERREPANPLETSLLSIWSEVLGGEQDSVAAPFWESGGNSLHAAQIIARIRAKLPIELSLAELFANPSVRDLATIIVRKLKSNAATGDVSI